MTETCSKYRVGDEYACRRCGTRWDTSDPEPPICEAEQPKPTTLTERLRALSRKMRQVSVLPSLCDDLDDMIEEVKLLDDERQRSRANAKGGTGDNITPLGPRRG